MKTWSTWSKKKKWLVGGGVALIALIIIGAVQPKNKPSTNPPAQPVAIVTVTATPQPAAVVTVTAKPKATHAAAPKPTHTAAPKPSLAAAPGPTAGQREAYASAKNYLSQQAFSRSGLIDQLHSQYGEGFSLSDATWAVAHCGANWNHEAYLSAKEYLSQQSFSLSGLIDQLQSSAGEGFTHSQAVWGATKAYNAQ
jgi:hypothetical protein